MCGFVAHCLGTFTETTRECSERMARLARNAVRTRPSNRMNHTNRPQCVVIVPAEQVLRQHISKWQFISPDPSEVHHHRRRHGPCRSAKHMQMLGFRSPALKIGTFCPAFHATRRARPRRETRSISVGSGSRHQADGGSPFGPFQVLSMVCCVSMGPFD